MYCANCGVKLADTEPKCPLCGTRAHPDVSRQEQLPLYPGQAEPERQVSTWGVQFILTTLFLLPVLICLQCDLMVTGSITWSGFVVGALQVCYVVGVLPVWFKRPNPVIFVPCGFAALLLYLLYISIATRGGWFLTFAFPVTGFVCLVVTAVVTLRRYVSRGALYIYGGAFTAMGLFMPAMGFLLNLTFYEAKFAFWSLLPMAAFVLLGGFLLFLAICRPARETMQRKFFI